MALGVKIKRLRQEQGWSQAELGARVHVHQKQISAYERAENIPSMEVLTKLAEAFNVTLDYLAFEGQSHGTTAKITIQDRELLRRFEAVDGLPDAYRALAKEMLDLLVLKHRFTELATSGPIR